jgi:hypothetical protein
MCSNHLNLIFQNCKIRNVLYRLMWRREYLRVCLGGKTGIEEEAPRFGKDVFIQDDS